MGITDPLFQGSTIAAEPIYDKNFFLHALSINKPNYACASTGFWGLALKKVLYSPKYAGTTFPYLFLPFVTGEGMSCGEEYFFNRASRKCRMGIDVLPFPISPVTFSVGGGTSESSGVLIVLFKRLQELRPYYLLYRKQIGLKTLKCCRTMVVNKNNNPCKAGKVGEIVISGPCLMKGYYRQPGLTDKIFFTDRHGQKWIHTKAYGVMDKKG